MGNDAKITLEVNVKANLAKAQKELSAATREFEDQKKILTQVEASIAGAQKILIRYALAAKKATKETGRGSKETKKWTALAKGQVTTIKKWKSALTSFNVVMEKSRNTQTKAAKAVLKEASAIKRLNKVKKETVRTNKQVIISTNAVSRAKKRKNKLTGNEIRLGKDVLIQLSRWRNRILLVTFALGGLISVLRESIEETQRQESAMRGLLSVGEKVGASFGQLMAAAKSLTEDGLITVGDAASSLKNLLATGFSLPEAINLMKAFKDSAAFGRQGRILGRNSKLVETHR